MKQLKLAVLPGDGIGIEVIKATLPIFQVLGLNNIELVHGDIGWDCWKRIGNPVPEKTWELLKHTDACLLGAITSKPLQEAEEELPSELKGKNLQYVSPVIQLRQQLSLFANIRPIISVKNNKKYNFVVIRENTEGLYAGLDYGIIPENIKEAIKENPKWKSVSLNKAACTIRLQTEQGLLRLFQYAFSYAKENNYHLVTFADKPNVMRKSSFFAKQLLERVAAKHPDIQYEILNVDAVGLWMVRRPERFGVIVAENMFGDILSDVGAGVMGGLGFAPSANIGSNYCYFEPVHGSAPTHAGQNKANPTAMFLTVALLLKHFGFNQESERIVNSVIKVVQENKVVTYDLGGKASTIEMANEILRVLS